MHYKRVYLTILNVGNGKENMSYLHECGWCGEKNFKIPFAVDDECYNCNKLFVWKFKKNGSFYDFDKIKRDTIEERKRGVVKI